MTAIYVSDEEYAQWEHNRLQRLAQARRTWQARRRRELARAQTPTRPELESQLHALRHHNETLTVELEDARDQLTFVEDLLCAVLDEFRAYRERHPERTTLRAA